jgi:hypothetical protein
MNPEQKSTYAIFKAKEIAGECDVVPLHQALAMEQQAARLAGALKEAIDRNQHDSGCAIFRTLDPVACDCCADERETAWRKALAAYEGRVG